MQKHNSSKSHYNKKLHPTSGPRVRKVIHKRTRLPRCCKPFTREWEWEECCYHTVE